MSGKNAKSGKGGNTIAKVHDMVMPIIDELGLSLWDIVFEKEGAYWYLRVFIDGKDDLASMEDCENVTRPLSKLLDEQDPIEQSYILEVGSPGIGRVLKKEEHFQKRRTILVQMHGIRV